MQCGCEDLVGNGMGKRHRQSAEVSLNAYAYTVNEKINKIK